MLQDIIEGALFILGAFLLGTTVAACYAVCYYAYRTRRQVKR